MIVFYRLLLAHMLADFVFHGNSIYDLKKHQGFLGYPIHGLIYFLCAFVCCMPFLNMVWWQFGAVKLNGFLCIFLLTLIHLAADKFNKADSMLVEGYNAPMFVLWQLAEFLALFLAAPPFVILEEPLLFNRSFTLIMLGALFSTYFLMVLFLLIRRDREGIAYPTFDEKYFNMFYRLVLYLLLVLPSLTSVIFGICWFLFVVWRQRKGLVCDKMRMYAGTVITAFFAIAVKILIQY